MPYIIAILGLIGAVSVWIWRARTAADAMNGIAGAAQDVLSAARRFGFRRRYNEHPVDSLEDGDVAMAGAGLAFLELSGLPSAEQHDALLISLQRHLGYDRAKAEEATILGRWLISECGGPIPGLARLTRRLFRLQGAAGLQPLMLILNDVATASRNGALSQQQREALDEVKRVFRLS